MCSIQLVVLAQNSPPGGGSTPIVPINFALYNNGSVLQINDLAVVQINGNFKNEATSTLTNNGQLHVQGNITNNQTMLVPNTGLVNFTGNIAQTLNGSTAFFANHVSINNPLGLTLAAPLQIDGECKFINGIVTTAATANAVTFTSNGFVSSTNAPADASHVNGYVVKEGTGAFTYPVGNGNKYQPCNVNLTANSEGMQVKYNATDAGTTAFTTTGTEAIALGGYNNNEYWNITPLGTANGTVTIFWDGYNDVFGNSLTARRVAHKTSGGWQNEGTTGTGTTSIGSVISNAISTWSPFALGSTPSILPLRWLNVTGNLNTQKQATINWQVQENKVATYEIEKSIDGRTFHSIAIINSKGNGTNSYTFSEVLPLKNIAYYRIKQIDVDGKFSFSAIIKLLNNEISKLAVYPNPATTVVNISMGNAKLLNTAVQLTDAKGAILQVIKLVNYNQQINVQQLAKAIYVLKFIDGTVLRFIKD